MLRRKLFYILLIGILGLLAILYASYVMSLIFLVALIFPVILAVIARYVGSKLQITVVSASKIEKKNKELNVDIVIKNPTIFPVARLVLKTNYRHHYESTTRKENLTTFVDANNEQKLTVHFSGMYCGNISFTVESFRLYDYLNIFTFKTTVNSEFVISILPEFQLIEEKMVWENPNVLLQSDIYSTIKSGDDSSEIFSIHEYKEGDRINHIHWKLSLKEDTLMVKDFGLPIDCSVIILIELYANHKQTLKEVDEALQIVLSLSFSMILSKQQHFIAWYDNYAGICKRSKIEKEEDLYETFSYLFQSRLYGESDAVVRFHAAEFENEAYTNIFYVTPTLTEIALHELEAAKGNAWCHIIAVSKESQLTEGVENNWISSTGFDFVNPSELLHS